MKTVLFLRLSCSLGGEQRKYNDNCLYSPPSGGGGGVKANLASVEQCTKSRSGTGSDRIGQDQIHNHRIANAMVVDSITVYGNKLFSFLHHSTSNISKIEWKFGNSVP